jgi:hypothetical protein
MLTKRKSKQFHKVRFKKSQGEIQKNSAKKYISIQGGVELKKPSILMVPEFHPFFFFS